MRHLDLSYINNFDDVDCDVDCRLMLLQVNQDDDDVVVGYMQHYFACHHIGHC